VIEYLATRATPEAIVDKKGIRARRRAHPARIPLGEMGAQNAARGTKDPIDELIATGGDLWRAKRYEESKDMYGRAVALAERLHRSAGVVPAGAKNP
jgi:hypothetical protein